MWFTTQIHLLPVPPNWNFSDMSVIALLYTIEALLLEIGGSHEKLIEERNCKDESYAPQHYYLSLKHITCPFISQLLI